MDWREKVKAIFGVIILIAVAGALYGWPDKIIQLAIEWGITIIIAVIMSGISGEIVEKFTGDTLKTITLTVEIADINFSVSLFFIATFAVRLLLFN